MDELVENKIEKWNSQFSILSVLRRLNLISMNTFMKNVVDYNKVIGIYWQEFYSKDR